MIVSLGPYVAGTDSGTGSPLFLMMHSALRHTHRDYVTFTSEIQLSFLSVAGKLIVTSGASRSLYKNTYMCSTQNQCIITTWVFWEVLAKSAKYHFS